ncbi:ATP-binding protein [Nannocystaceae bacterium ST9]
MDVHDASFPLPGYVVRRWMAASRGGRVFELGRVHDGRSLIAHVHRYADPLQRAGIEHELESLRSATPEGVAALLAVERVDEQLIAIVDAPVGVSLAEHLAGRVVALGEFLVLASALADVVARVHTRVEVHADLRPTSVFVDPETRAIELADLGLARVLDSGRSYTHEPEFVRTTLAYCAPEQLRSGQVDSRSDLHALGVIYYELLTGRRPFAGTSASETIHALLARRPRPVQELRDELPRRLTAIVMKLLEKLPEQRYQSARGLHADLQRLSEALSEGEAEPEFPLGEHDHPTRLRMPQRLIGRAAQLAKIARSLAELREGSEPRLAFVTGGLGAGKTALLQAIEPPAGVVQARGRFVDPRADRPFRGFVEVLGDLLVQVVGEGEARRAEWRELLRERVGPRIEVLGDLVPALAELLGSERPAQASDGAFGLVEVQSSLQIAIRRLLAALAERAPIVVVLDDLQQADLGSRDLLRALASGIGGPVFVVVAADLEATPDLSELHRELVDRGRAFGLELAAFTLDDLIAMLMVMLGQGADQVRSLARFVLERTAGNPLFVHEVLRALEERGHLRLGEQGWCWTPEAIDVASFAGDPLELIRARLARLAPELRELLARAACIDAQFDFARLRVLMPTTSERELGRRLHELVGEGLVVRVGAEYRFAEDRVRAQLLATLPPDACTQAHWQLAIALRGRLGDELGPRRFEVADHVAFGRPAAGELAVADRRALIELEFAAGEHALRAAAWTHAERYLCTALGLLELGEREPGDVELEFAVRFAHAQALALCKRTREADEAFAGLLAADPSLAEFGRVVARRVQILVMEDRPRLGLEVGLAALARCGQRPGASKLALALALRRTRRALETRDLAGMAASSVRVRDERIDAALWILDAIQTPAFLLDRRLWMALCVRHFALVLEHGFHATASIAFVQQAIVFAALRDAKAAAQLSDLALVLAERGPTQLRARVECRARLFVWPYTRPFAALVGGIAGLFRRALDVGDRETAGYVTVLGLRSQLEAGLPLREVVAFGQRALAELEPWATVDQRAGTLASLRAAEALLGRTTSRYGAAEAADAGAVTRVGVVNAAALTDWLLGRRALAFRELDRIAGEVGRAAFGTWLFARHALLHAVGAVEQFELAGRPLGRRRAVIELVRGHLKRLRRQAEVAPINFGAMAELVAAELSRVRGRDDAALQGYEHARTLADEQGHAYVAGIAAERLAELAIRLDQPLSAAGSLKLARESYLRWGAGAVVERLEQEHPELFGESRASEAGISQIGDVDLDIATGAMLATLQAISEELRLDRVIVRVLAAAIEHAGADRGVLLLERGGSIGIVAEGTPGSISEFLDAPTPLSLADDRVPKTVIEAVLRTTKAVIFDEFDQDPSLAGDPYFANQRAASLLCLAIVKRGRPVGALLLEHESAVQQFTLERLEALRSFASQAAAALDNARLFDALQRSDAQWRTVVGGVPDIIALIDERGRVEFVNHLDPFPVDPSKVAGGLATASMAASSVDAWTNTLAAVLAGAGAQELEIQIAPPKHPPRWYAVRLAPIEVGGRVEKVITIATDIEDRKSSEVDRARLEAQLRQQQRLESLGTLASGVAHEINNPIQGIMNYAELIGHRAHERELVEEFAAEIHHESERVAAIVRNLLAFSRQEREQQETETIAIAIVVERMLSLVHSVLRKDRIQLEVALADDLPALTCRPQQVQQILMNLVTNARDALLERAEQAEARGALGPDRWIRLHAASFVREGVVWIRVSVEDRGGGIDEDVLGRIFDPFFTTKGRDKGTGLGLAVSHGIAVEHGGRLWVDNRPGVGATFHLDLPAERRVA